MKIIAIDGMTARAETMGVVTEVNITLVPDVAVNSKVLVHAGFAIEHLSENEAQDIEAAWEELNRAIEAEDKK
jgi:hydrogenase assembly chaperone HypC/HupF